jgi:hypothetical protein
MDRAITKQLVKWMEKPNRKPLVLKGVRQCGKTYVLKEFGIMHYQDTVYLNFEETPSLSAIFEKDLDVQRLLFELGLSAGKSILPRTNLLILDEIQECPRALTALKYFCENAPEYHIACAGSLLGIAIHEDQSFPVGKVDILTLYPMSFLEFLDALGERPLREYLEKLPLGDTLPAPVNTRLQTALRQYYVTGGMPEAVSAWCRTKDLSQVEEIQQNILTSYELDLAKHAPVKDFPKLSAIWAAVPQQLAKPNSKFIFSQVKKGWRAKDLEDALQWLERAGLVHRVCRVEQPFMPLSSYADASYFKLYLCDVGLLRRLARLPAKILLDSSELYREFKGAMAENYVLQELVCENLEPLYYWTSGNSAEVDFLAQIDMHIVPIEVKSETNTKARSLAEYRKKYQPSYAVITSMEEAFSGDSLIRIPLYLISEISRIIS